MEVGSEPEAAENVVEVKGLCQGTQLSIPHTFAPATADYRKADAVVFSSFESILPKPLMQIIQAYGAPS